MRRQTIPLAIAQLSPVKGDYPENLRRLGAVFRQLDSLAERPRVLHLAETALTGYLVEGGVRELAMTAGTLARDLDAAYREVAPGRPPLDIIVGFYELWNHTLHNSALYARLGEGEEARVLHVHRKNFLPTYALFDEERFVERGTEVSAFDTEWGRAGILICEDVWHSLAGTVLALDGAEIVYVCAAAPGRGTTPADGEVRGPATVARWERLIRGVAEEHGVVVSMASLTGSEGGKIFSGSSMLAGPDGELIVRGPVWDEALLAASVDLSEITRVRSDSPLLSDLRVQLPHLGRSLRRSGMAVPRTAPPFDPAEGEVAGTEQPAATGQGANTVQPTVAGGLPVIVAAPHLSLPSLEIDGELVEQWLVRFLRDELAQRGFGKVVIGISGGVDSAVTAYLAARALGPENVLGVRMPYRTSSAQSNEHGQLVIDALGIGGITVEISGAVDAYLSQVPAADATRRGNVMARMRMLTLFDLAAHHGALPLGTGNKTERLFGYFTWHADDTPPINPLGDLFKTQVWALARHLGVPAEIVDKPATADLVQGQTDEGDLGISYPRADGILSALLSGFTPRQLVESGFTGSEVALTRRRLDGTHWKRRLPTVAVVSTTAIGESYLRPVDY